MSGGAKALRWFAAWTALGLAFTARTWVADQRLAEQHPYNWWQALRADLPDWYLWGLVALIVPRLVRRWPLESRRWRANLPRHIVVAIGIALAHLVTAVLLQYLLRRLGGEPYPLASRLVDNFVIFYLWNVTVYVTILALTLAGQFRDEARARSLEAAHLEAQLTRARLDALAVQLQPHFLFNTLNGIAELMHTDVEAADRMLSGLGTLLRAALDAGAGAEVSLQSELGVVEQYFAIQRARFSDRLRVDLDVAADVRRAVVPGLVLLPLVENAVTHGLGSHGGRGHVGVRAHRDGADLFVEVWDDGPGLAERPSERGRGIGLANTRERLRALYGRDDALTVGPGPSGGVVARLRLPFREAAA